MGMLIATAANASKGRIVVIEAACITIDLAKIGPPDRPIAEKIEFINHRLRVPESNRCYLKFEDEQWDYGSLLEHVPSGEYGYNRPKHLLDASIERELLILRPPTTKLNRPSEISYWTEKVQLAIEGNRFQG